MFFLCPLTWCVFFLKGRCFVSQTFPFSTCFFLFWVVKQFVFGMNVPLFEKGWIHLFFFCDVYNGHVSSHFSSLRRHMVIHIQLLIGHTVDGRNPAPEVGSLPHYLQGFIHPRWCRISSIKCIYGKYSVTKVGRLTFFPYFFPWSTKITSPPPFESYTPSQNLHSSKLTLWQWYPLKMYFLLKMWICQIYLTRILLKNLPKETLVVSCSRFQLFFFFLVFFWLTYWWISWTYWWIPWTYWWIPWTFWND